LRVDGCRENDLLFIRVVQVYGVHFDRI